MKSMTIGKVAMATGVKVTTIRYYESIGLLAEPGRSESGQRQYGNDAIDRLNFIRHARELGFAIPSIRDLVTMQDEPESGCETVDAIARENLEKVRSRLQRLRALEAELEKMINNCEGGSVGSCRILQVLSDHALCADTAHLLALEGAKSKFVEV
ncbi:MAG: MerR family transcriptional regulator [Litorimonas sp.]